MCCKYKHHGEKVCLVYAFMYAYSLNLNFLRFMTFIQNWNVTQSVWSIWLQRLACWFSFSLLPITLMSLLHHACKKYIALSTYNFLCPVSFMEEDIWPLQERHLLCFWEAAGTTGTCELGCQIRCIFLPLLFSCC